MNPKAIGIFALGFAAGLLCLGVLLWSTHQLRTVTVAAGSKQIHVPGTMPDLSLVDRLPKPDSPVVPPPASAEGEADRMAPASLSMPIQGVDVKRLSDTFNQARDGRKHEALDIPAPLGTPVHATAEGNVAKLFTSKEGGLTVYQFDDSGTWCYYYAHLDHYAPGMTEGVLLRKGDVLGYVGSTGNASPKAPHLHFAVFRLGPEKKWWQGQAVDPLPLLK